MSPPNTATSYPNIRLTLMASDFTHDLLMVPTSRTFANKLVATQ